MAFLEVPALVTKIASLDLSGPVRPIGQDVYRTLGPAGKADVARLATIARDEVMGRIERAIGSGRTGTAAFAEDVARLDHYNEIIRANS